MYKACSVSLKFRHVLHVFTTPHTPIYTRTTDIKVQKPMIIFNYRILYMYLKEKFSVVDFLYYKLEYDGKNNLMYYILHI